MNICKKHLPRHRLLTIGMAVLTLLTLCACATVPPKEVAASLANLPVGETAVLPPPPATLPPLAVATTISSPPLPPVEIAAPPPELAAAEPPPVVTAEPVEEVSTPPPAYYSSHATYYAKRFNGRRTYTGERYDPEKLTAATRDFPLHSWLKVINPANGREVNVRINDLPGKRKTPLVDLSRAAAKALDFLGKGRIRVHVIPLLPTP